MKLSHITNLLYGRPLLITKSGFNVIDSIVQAKLRGEKLNPALFEDFEDGSSTQEEDNPYTMTIVDGIANIYIQGPIGKKLSLLQRMCGACDVDVVREELDMAATYPDVETIVLNFDSPGGSVEGVPELAEYIAETNKKKNCIALVDGMCCSAAYYMASGCSEIIAVGKTSNIGSIGCYVYLLDESRMYENAGVEPILVKAGDNKGEMMPGMPIERDTIDNLQKEVDYIYGLFTSHVKTYRKNVENDSMQGRSYMSEEALNRGLIDGIVSVKNELFFES